MVETQNARDHSGSYREWLPNARWTRTRTLYTLPFVIWKNGKPECHSLDLTCPENFLTSQGLPSWRTSSQHKGWRPAEDRRKDSNANASFDTPVAGLCIRRCCCH